MMFRIFICHFLYKWHFHVTFSMFVTFHALLVEIDYLILSDLDAFADFPHEVEPFILHLFSQSLSEKAVLQLY